MPELPPLIVAGEALLPLPVRPVTDPEFVAKHIARYGPVLAKAISADLARLA